MALHCIQVDPAVAIARGLFQWLAAGDAVLLLGPASTLARSGDDQLAAWLAHDVTLHALQEALGLHGIETVDPRVRVTDYAGWVELVIAHPQQLNWS